MDQDRVWPAHIAGWGCAGGSIPRVGRQIRARTRVETFNNVCAPLRAVTELVGHCMLGWTSRPRYGARGLLELSGGVLGLFFVLMLLTCPPQNKTKNLLYSSPHMCCRADA